MLFFSLNISNWWYILFMIELMNWFLVYFLKNNLSLILIFFIWQSISSICLVYRLWIFKTLTLISLFIFIKISFPPFHYFLWKFIKNWSWQPLLIFIFPHKFMLIIIVNRINLRNWFLLFFLLPLVFIYNIWFKLNVKTFIFGVIIIDSSWFLFSRFIRINLLLTYLLLNFFFFIILFKIFSLNDSHSFDKKLQYVCLFFLGLPPFISFQLKWLIIVFIPDKFWLNLIITLFTTFYLWNLFFLVVSDKEITTSLEKVEKRTQLILLINLIWFLFI